MNVERYRWLIDEIGRDLNHGRGWKRRAAEKLGVHPSYVSKVLSGSLADIGVDVMDRAVERLGLPRGFFSCTDADLAAFLAAFRAAEVDRPRSELRRLRDDYERLCGACRASLGKEGAR